MTRFLVAASAAFLLTNSLPAQSAQPMGPNGQSAPGAGDCEQIRQAVAQYGYKAAKKFALIHYGKDAARYGDRCLTAKQKKG